MGYYLQRWRNKDNRGGSRWIQQHRIKKQRNTMQMIMKYYTTNKKRT